MTRRYRPSPFVIVSDALPYGKLWTLGPEAVTTWLAGLCLAHQLNSDGAVNGAAAAAVAGTGPEWATALVAAGHWHEEGHSCERCPQPAKGMVQIHDYLQWQESAADREAASDRGRSMAQARWNAVGNAVSNAGGNAVSNAESNAVGNAVRNAEKRREEKREETGKPVSSAKDKSLASRASRAAQLPEEWEPSPHLLEWAQRRHGVTNEGWLRNQTDQFRHHAQANGRVQKDWNASWQKWIDKGVEMARDRGQIVGDGEDLEALVDEELRLHPRSLRYPDGTTLSDPNFAEIEKRAIEERREAVRRELRERLKR